MYHVDPDDLSVSTCINVLQCDVRGQEEYPDQLHADTENIALNKMRKYASEKEVKLKDFKLKPGDIFPNSEKSAKEETVREQAFKLGIINNPNALDNMKVVTQQVYSMTDLDILDKSIFKKSLLSLYSYYLKKPSLPISPEVKAELKEIKKEKIELTEDTALYVYNRTRDKIIERLLKPSADNKRAIEELLGAENSENVSQYVEKNFHNLARKSFFARAYQEGFVFNHKVEREFERAWFTNKRGAYQIIDSGTKNSSAAQKFVDTRGRINPLSYGNYILKTL